MQMTIAAIVHEYLNWPERVKTVYLSIWIQRNILELGARDSLAQLRRGYVINSRRRRYYLGQMRNGFGWLRCTRVSWVLDCVK